MVVSSETIRAAQLEDHDAVLALWDGAGLGRTTEDEWSALLSGATSVVLVAEREGAIVGAAVATFDGWRAYIYHVAVSPEYRRKGLGHELMQAAEQDLTAAGARYVYVMVPESNTEGMALVGSTGYLPEGDMAFTKRLASRD